MSVFRALLALAVLLAGAGASRADLIVVRVTNLQPTGGTFLTPIFLATHDGVYDFFNVGSAASSSVERLAEDGTTGPRIAAALATGRVNQATATSGGPIGPGESREVTFDVSATNSRAQFLAFMSMIIPSNDAFIGNDDPRLLPLFDANGQVIQRLGAGRFVITGNDVLDGGTEVNDEVPENTAFLNQTVPDTGVVETLPIRQHPGFQGSLRLGGPTGNILQRFPNGDFTQPGALIASIEVRSVPAPAALSLLLAGAPAMLLAARARRRPGRVS